MLRNRQWYKAKRKMDAAQHPPHQIKVTAASKLQLLDGHVEVVMNPLPIEELLDTVSKGNVHPSRSDDVVVIYGPGCEWAAAVEESDEESELESEVSSEEGCNVPDSDSSIVGHLSLDKLFL